VAVLPLALPGLASSNLVRRLLDVPTVHEQARAVRQHDRQPRAAGEASEESQPFSRWRDVFAEMLVSARYEKSVNAQPVQFGAQISELGCFHGLRPSSELHGFVMACQQAMRLLHNCRGNRTIQATARRPYIAMHKNSAAN